jgi:hypothetical protein
MISIVSRILDTSRDYPKAFKFFKEFEEVFLSYAGFQKAVFYDELRKGQLKDNATIKMTEFLEHDLQQLKVDFLELMEHYPPDAGPVRVRNFPREFYEFSRKIIDRISLEEDRLFPLLSDQNK